jgi:hypothetical protein
LIREEEKMKRRPAMRMLGRGGDANEKTAGDWDFNK